MNTKTSTTSTTTAQSAGVRPDWLDRNRYPFTLRRLETPAGSVAYIDEGQGPTLLFVHAGVWSFIFRDAINRLVDDFRCVTFDFPGYGLSPDPATDPDDSHRLQWLSRTVEHVVDELALDKVTLVAHDLGGPVGMAAAVRYPEHYRAFVLANTFIWPPDTASLRGMLRVVGSGPMTALGTATNLVPRLTSGKGGVGRNLDDGDRALFLEPFNDTTRRKRFHLTMRAALVDVGLAAELSQVGPVFGDRPVLSIFGEKNDPFGFQNRIAELFTDHRGVVVDGGNHFPMCDAPDFFVAELRQWYDSVVAVESS